MIRKLSLIVAALALVACGNGNGDGGDGAADATPTGSPAAAADPLPEGVEAAPSDGGVNRPAPGTYTYDLTGQSATEAAPDPLEQAGTFTNEVTADGDTTRITAQTTLTAPEERPPSSTFTTTYRWEEERMVETGYLADRQQFPDQDCTYAEPLTIFTIPIEAQTFEPVEITGEGSLCAGTVSVVVEGQGTAQDVDGRTWDTWAIEITRETPAEGFVTTARDKWWFSPDLGIEIRLESETIVENDAGTRVSRSVAERVLASYPT